MLDRHLLFTPQLSVVAAVVSLHILPTPVVKLVRFFTNAIRATRNLFRRRTRSPSPTPAPTPICRSSTPPRVPTPVPTPQSSISDPSLHVHIPTRPPTPAPSSTRASSVLTESSTETVFEDKLATFRPPSPIVFADQDIFEPEHHLFEQEREELDLELQIISNINQEIARNPAFYRALVAEFRYDGIVPGTDLTFRAFAAQHQGARELERQEINLLAEGYTGADDELNPDNDPNLTPPATPHPSAGVTPAIHESSLPNESTSGSLNEEVQESSDSSTPNFSA